MSTHDRSLHAPRAGILARLGLGLGLGRSAVFAPQSDARAAIELPPDALAATLVAEIGGFLGAHHLDVTSFSLGIAHDYLTGEDTRLVRAIDSRLQSGGTITLDWLAEAVNSSEHDEIRRVEDRLAMSALMIKVQGNLEEFDRTTTAAKSAATEYGSALQVHVGEMKRSDSSGAVIAEIAHLAAAMLERTQELEREMSRSEVQTRALQRNLDHARRTAEKDHLTGLPNRRAFESRLAAEYAAAQQNHQPLCVAFCDIDNFKAINDTHGHDAGDRILKAVAHNLARISNDSCHVARHGGEEFVVLFRGHAIGDCWELLDDARAQQAERRLVNRATDVAFGRVTFSAGISDIFAFPSPRSALRAADKALYRAKEEGRNRVVIAHRAPVEDLAPAN